MWNKKQNDKWKCGLLNALFIFNGIEYNKLHFYLSVYEFDLYASRRFWTLFSPKKYTLTFTWINLYASIYGMLLDVKQTYINTEVIAPS